MCLAGCLQRPGQVISKAVLPPVLPGPAVPASPVREKGLGTTAPHRLAPLGISLARAAWRQLGCFWLSTITEAQNHLLSQTPHKLQVNAGLRPAGPPALLLANALQFHEGWMEQLKAFKGTEGRLVQPLDSTRSQKHVTDQQAPAHKGQNPDTEAKSPSNQVPVTLFY